MSITNIKIANEAKQDSVIKGQEDIISKIKTPRIKTTQKGVVNARQGALTNTQRAIGYEFPIAQINSIDPNKSELEFNANYLNMSNEQYVGGYPLIYGTGDLDTGRVGTAWELFGLKLKSDGIYASPVSKTFTGDLYYFLREISWQVIEFY